MEICAGLGGKGKERKRWVGYIAGSTNGYPNGINTHLLFPDQTTNIRSSSSFQNPKITAAENCAYRILISNTKSCSELEVIASQTSSVCNIIKKIVRGPGEVRTTLPRSYYPTNFAQQLPGFLFHTTTL